MNKKLFFCFALIVSAALLLFSCTSAPKHLAKAIAKDKPYVASETRKLWPCIVTASDTVHTSDTLYDLIEAQCPDVEYITPEGKTIYLPGKVTTVQGPTITKYQTITVKVKDSAETFLLLNDLEVQGNILKDREDDLKLSQQEVKDEQKAKSKWRKWCLITWGLIAVGVAGKLLLSKYKLFV